MSQKLSIDATFSGKKVAFATLGCKLNFSETSHITRLFKEKGFEYVNYNEKADVYVINTCSVTENANKKCRQTIAKAAKQAPDAFIVVMGCYSQLNPEELKNVMGVDLILGTQEKFSIFDHLKKLEKKKQADIYSCDIKKDRTFFPSYSENERTRAFLKIQDGCDYFCSYCTIPYARGRSRNSSIKELISSINNIVEKGVKEIVITGVNIGDFGRTTGESLHQLLEKIEDTRVLRVRLSSIEPDLLKDETIQLIAKSKKILPHFHIPLQSGSNKILKIMNRRYKRELFADKVKMIREVMPFAGVGVDVIVGFPGETEEDFNDTFDFINSLDVSYLHVFTFSERENTKAAKMADKIDPKEKDRRSKVLHKLGEEKKRDFYNSAVGQKHKVLFEAKNNKGKMHGFTENYIKVEAKFDPDFVENIKDVEITGISSSGNANIKE